MEEPTEEVVYRSVSQLQQYERCPYAYYLARVKRAWQRPAAWLAQGTALHEAVEAYERSGRTMALEAAQDVFREAYRREINEACAVTPNWQYWFKSGPYAPAQDIPRRMQLGLDQVRRYFDWTAGHPEEAVWIAPDGTPAIELGFDIDLDGVRVRGYIDAVITIKSTFDSELRVRDHKSGNNPGDDFQLGVYGLAVAETYGEMPPFGDYWMGRSGKATAPFDLSAWPKDRVTEVFHGLEDNIQAGRFPARPEPSKCKFCDVSAICEYAVV